ncbi:SRPBCC domain-containing protein [Agrobacterium leguminum]|uniref:SRPBCC domain-containing protein n=1 Tax=Agrobacterium leguminum TaxID=2792015 RepID=UPI003312FEB5
MFCRTDRCGPAGNGLRHDRPDGRSFRNHHRYVEVRPEERIAYTLLWGENGPKHADAWASFEDEHGATKVVWAWCSARKPSSSRQRVSAPWAGQQTLGKLERFAKAL